jgi:DnaJ like chaperone protein
MGLLGALFGGTVGFMLGGPLGAIIGGSLGAQVGFADRAAAYRSRAGGYSAQELQSAFLIAVISLAAKTAKADGTVTVKEVRTRTVRFSESFIVSSNVA